MYKPKHEKQQYDPEMPCNKKGCDASARASCCGKPNIIELVEQGRQGNLLKNSRKLNKLRTALV